MVAVAGCGAADDQRAAAGTPAMPAATEPSSTLAPGTEPGGDIGASVVVPPPTTADTSATSDDPPSTTGAAAAAPTAASCGETHGRTTRFTFASKVFAPSPKPVQPYLVHTPPCYDPDQARRYPVIYLLHGAQTDETQWADVGVLDTADRLTAAGQIPPVILVLPDALHAMGDYGGATPPLDWFVLYELQPRVEQAFRTRTDAAHRAIGGISRGGEWALLIAGRHPDVFSTVGGHSPAVGVPTNPGPQLAGLLADRGLRIWLDVGDRDSLASPVAALDQALTARGVDHETHVGDGGHDRAYWGAMTEAYLRWYTAPWADDR